MFLFLMQVIISCRHETEFGIPDGKGNLTIKPQIKFIQGSEVFFVDDTSACVDVILLCTG